MGDVEALEYTLELPIGTTSYYWNRLYEVVEPQRKELCCLGCALWEEIINDAMCQVMNCGGDGYRKRHDGKRAVFKEIKKPQIDF